MKTLPLLLAALFASPAFADTYQIRIPASIDPAVAASLETPGQARLSLSPGTYDFGDVPIEQSGRYTFNLSNVGDKAAYLSFSPLSAPFSLTHDCPAWLSASGACSFAVEFAPGATGQVSASLTINGGIGAQHAGLSLSGTGLPRAPDPAALTASPGVLEFEPTFTTLTRTATLTLTNTGESTAQLQLPFGASGPFSVASTTCAVTLAPGASCQVGYRFAPQAEGPVEATVMLRAADPATPATLTLRGEGRLPGALTLSTPSLDFGSVLLTTEAPQSVTLTNTGAAPVALPASFVVSAPFGLVAEDCPESLAAGASCTISLKYAPTQAGVSNQTLSISSTQEVTPVTLAMTGTGQAPGVLSPSVSTLDFGSVKIGTTKDLALVLTNSGATALTLPDTFSLEAPYTLQSEDCTTSLAPAATCTLNIRFAPTAEGVLAKTLSIPGSTAVPAVNVALTGTGQKLGIITSGATRTWEDGTVAASCNAYRNPAGNYLYTGATGSGTYRIDPDGAGGIAAFDAHCDMTSTPGKGYTLLARAAGSPVHASVAEADCAANGLQLFVPRTKAHFDAARAQFGAYRFVMMGIYPKFKGAQCMGSDFTSSGCANWGPKNGTAWFVQQGINVTEPNGDNDVDGSMQYGYDASGNITWYNDIPNTHEGGYKAANYICSSPNE